MQIKKYVREKKLFLYTYLKIIYANNNIFSNFVPVKK